VHTGEMGTASQNVIKHLSNVSFEKTIFVLAAVSMRQLRCFWTSMNKTRFPPFARGGHRRHYHRRLMDRCNCNQTHLDSASLNSLHDKVGLHGAKSCGWLTSEKNLWSDDKLNCDCQPLSMDATAQGGAAAARRRTCALHSQQVSPNQNRLLRTMISKAAITGSGHATTSREMG